MARLAKIWEYEYKLLDLLKTTLIFDMLLCIFIVISDFEPMVFSICYCIYILPLSTPIRLYEVLSNGGSLRTWKNEQRIWMIKMLTSCLFGCIDVLLKWLSITKASFRLTNKAIDQEKLKKYEKGKFDFQGAEMFMIPLKLLVLLNMVCFIIGVNKLNNEYSLFSINCSSTGKKQQLN